jgi:hypothetical protein
VDAQAQRSPSGVKRAVKRSTVTLRLVEINPTEAEDSVMRQRVLISPLAAPAAPAGAQCAPSYVGQFASTLAREDIAAFGADVSFTTSGDRWCRSQNTNGASTCRRSGRLSTTSCPSRNP